MKSGISWRGTGLHIHLSLEYICAHVGIGGWESCKVERTARRTDFFFFFLVHCGVGAFLSVNSAHALSSLICACQNRYLHDFSSYTSDWLNSSE